ncbi:MAG TPA: AMIN domain-containing protein [Candidatus Desulfovibrio gallistercoris]|nr:AMIN domain-containing protein [Candidatus Desulfovibrio gallistercoris]
MNKAFIGILIAVCILGMALIMLNEWKSSKNDPEPASPALEASPATPDGLPSHTGSSLTPPVPGDAAAPAPVETAPAAEAPAATPPSEALERGFAFNDTEAVPPQDMPLPVTEGAARPAQDVPPQPALGSGAASEPPAAPSVPAATETRQPPVAEVEPAAPEKKEEKKAEKPAPAAKARTVTRFVVFARETGATVRIEGSSPIEYKYLPLDNPPRVAVDLMGEWTVKAPGVPKNPAVTNVRLGKLDGRTRVVIDLTGPGKIRHILSKDRKRLDVRIDR